MELKIESLTEKEKQTLELIIKGYSNKEIGKELTVTVHTVKAHIENIYRKFGVHNKVQAAIFAIYHNLVELETL